MYVWATVLALQLSNLDILDKNKLYAFTYGNWFVQLWPILLVILLVILIQIRIAMQWQLGEKSDKGELIKAACAVFQLVWILCMCIYGLIKDAPIHTIFTKLNANDLYDCTGAVKAARARAELVRGLVERDDRGADCKHENDAFTLIMIKFKTICDISLSVPLSVFLLKIKLEKDS